MGLYRLFSEPFLVVVTVFLLLFLKTDSRSIPVSMGGFLKYYYDIFFLYL